MSIWWLMQNVWLSLLGEQDLPAAVEAYKQGLGVRRRLLAAAAANLEDHHQQQQQQQHQAEAKQQEQVQQGAACQYHATVPLLSCNSLSSHGALHLQQLAESHASKALDVVASLLKLADACSALGAPLEVQRALQAEARDLVQHTGPFPSSYPSSYAPSPSISARQLQLTHVLEALSR